MSGWSVLPAKTARASPTASRRHVRQGDAVRLLNRLGRSYVLGIRVATLAPTVIIAVLAAWGTRQMPAVVGALTVVVLWSAAFVCLLRRGGRPWVPVVDTGVLTALALTAPLVVPSEWVATGKSWLLPFVAFACVATQYYTAPLRGALYSVVIGAGTVIGTLLALPPGGSSASVVTSAWVLVLSVLGRILWSLASRAGRFADDIADDAATARRELAVASALRADEHALANELHDTAAATLLMIGIGQVDQNTPMLRRRARRDIEVLDGYGRRPEAITDLVALLEERTKVVPLRCTLTAPSHMRLPTPVANALAGAATEALNNVVKHSGTTSAAIVLRGNAAAPRLSVLDRGCGFDPDADRPGGRGLRESVAGRMKSIGGTWNVLSEPGAGTAVHLEWNHHE